MVGRTVHTEGTVAPPYGLPRQSVTVVGVMAEEFRFPSDETQFWVPLNLARDGGSANVAWLREGISAAAATDEVNALLRERRPPGKDASARPRFEVAGVQDEMAASVRPVLWILFASVGLVLLIACANVANLVLARASVRGREMSIRTSLGAARWRLTRQMITEGLVLATLGGIAGWILALGGLQLLRASLAGLSPQGNIRQIGAQFGQSFAPPSLGGIHLDPIAFAFTAAICFAIGIGFGLAPTFRLKASKPMDALRSGAGASASGFGLFRRNAGRSLLVVGQIALAVTLAVAGGLLIHSFARLLLAENGYDPRHVLTFQKRAPRGHYTNQQLRRFSEDLVARLEAQPNIRGAAYGILPLVSFIAYADLRITPGEQLPPPPGGEEFYSAYRPELRLVSPHYRDVMGMKVAQGQGFSSTDGGTTRRLLINETLARGRFPRENPVGKQVFMGEDVWEIRGVVADVRQQGLDVEPTPQVFVNFVGWPSYNEIADDPRYYSVRTSGEPTAVLASVRETVRQLDGEVMLDNVATMEQLVASSIARPRLYAVLLGLFAEVAIMLAAIGTYGVMAYAVTQNTREIGLRIALGARPHEVLGLVLLRASVLAGAGTGIGILLSVAVSRYLQGLIFGLTSMNLPTYIAVAIIFAAGAMAASYIPARRASRVDPLVALRAE